MHEKPISDPDSASLDEDATIEAAKERSNVPQLLDILRAEHDEVLKGKPRGIALEKWGADIGLQILADLEKQKIP
jgi:hypothetical protein